MRRSSRLGAAAPSSRTPQQEAQNPESDTGTLRRSRRTKNAISYDVDGYSSADTSTPSISRTSQREVKTPVSGTVTLKLSRRGKNEYVSEHNGNSHSNAGNITPTTTKTPQREVKSSVSNTGSLRRSGRKRNVTVTEEDGDGHSSADDATPTSSRTSRTPKREGKNPGSEMSTSRLSRRRKNKVIETDDDGGVVADSSEDNTTPTTTATPRRSARKKSEQRTPAPVPPQLKKSPEKPAKVKKLEWKFNVYGVPKCPLPCRESQFEEIWKFIFENITEKNSGCMYVSGVPGTGKTVIVKAVIDLMQKINEEKKNLEFKYLYVNGLTLASPDKLWKRMFKGLGLTTKSSSISSKEALKRLDTYFEGHERIPVVLVVDELDQILDKQQSILYQLLEWSSHATNMFSLLAIFNTMSLPEQGLAMRNNSRMGFKRAVFPPYSYEELQTIVHNMLSTFKTVNLSAECVSLLSRKVAAISGDARRALEIARRTLEIAESGQLTGIQAVSHAFKEIFSSARIETIRYTSFLEQMILKAVCDEIRCSGIEEISIAKVYDAVIPKAVYEGVQYHKDDILKALMRLAVMKLVLVEDNCPSLHKRLLLNVPVEDVNFALGCESES